MGAPYGKPGAPAPDAGAARAGTPPAGAAGAAGGGGAAGAAGGAGAAGAAGAAGRGGGRGGCAQGAYCGGDPGYYQEIFVDPIRPDTIWSANTNLEWSRDGGRSWSGVPNLGSVHVDFHDVWADPKDKLHILVANDGGAYESWDEGKTWRHFDNLPVTQFYRVSVDDALPFYNVCGGAQDNESQCGPSRSINRVGVRLSDWWMIGGCDGFTSRSEPGNPNIVYTSCQSGGIARLDQRTGENKQIRPGGANVIPNPNDPPAPAAPPPDAAGGGAGGRRRRTRRWRRRADELGRAVHHQSVLADAALLGQHARLSQRRSRRSLDADQPRSVAQSRSARDSNHGQDLGSESRPSPTTTRRRRSATSCRSTSRR